jgi:hypothetical protein
MGSRFVRDTRLGEHQNRWAHLPEGIERLMMVPDEIRKCVGFIYFKREGQWMPAGTAFFLAVPMEGTSDGTHSYVVTAKHVIDWVRFRSDDGKAVLRLNMPPGAERSLAMISIDVDEWHTHPTDTSVDVAVLPGGPGGFDHLIIHSEMSLTPDLVREHQIGPGDEVFMTGLFVNHFGNRRNIPIVRAGNIAAMPEEKVATPLGPIDAYLVESRSIGGLSGSPAFVYLGVVRKLGEQVQFAQGSNPGGIYFLMGLVHGHWDAKIGAEHDAMVEDGLAKEAVNMGIAIVVPIDKVIEVIMQDDLEPQRKEDRDKVQQETMPTMDVAAEEADFTRDDFMRDLTKVTEPNEKSE